MSYTAIEMAAAFIQAGELEEAFAALSEHLNSTPDDAQARRWRMQVLRHLPLDDAPRIAQTDFKHLDTHIPDDYMHLALLLEQGEALAVLRDGLAQWPDHEGLTERYIGLLRNSRDWAEALALLRDQPPDWRWLQLEGDLLAEHGDAMLATARYSQALNQLEQLNAHPYLDAMKARLHLIRAATYRRLGFLDQAMQDYLAAEAIVPDDPVIPFNRGLIAWLEGDAEGALALCRPALAQANAALRAEMLREVENHPRYAALLQELKP